MEPLPFSTEGDTQPSVQLPLFEEPPRDEADKLSSPRSDNPVLPASTCTFCGRTVDPKSDTTYAEVRSWVSGPKKDSAVLRDYTGLYADGDCISLLRSGLHPTQKTLEETANAAPVSETAEYTLVPERSENWHRGYLDGLHDNNLGLSEDEDYNQGFLEGQIHLIQPME